MKILCTFASAVVLMLSAHAQSMSDGMNYSVIDPNAELVYHTAAPGMMILPRSDMEQMVMAYDLTAIPREGEAFIRWGRLNENGEGEGLWTKWRDFDDVITFSTPGRYVVEVHAEGIGKERSSTLKASFKVDYLGMTYAPGVIL